MIVLADDNLIHIPDSSFYRFFVQRDEGKTDLVLQTQTDSFVLTHIDHANDVVDMILNDLIEKVAEEIATGKAIVDVYQLFDAVMSKAEKFLGKRSKQDECNQNEDNNGGI